MTRAADAAEVIRGERLVAIVRSASREGARVAVEALLTAGVRAVEVSLTTPGALEIVTRAAKTLPDSSILGVGTVTTAAAAEAAIDAGATFLVSPTLSPGAHGVARARDVLFIPGAFTPTEIDEARSSGATLIKLFPAGVVGPDYVRDLLGPFPELQLVPTGGVNADNARRFLESGAVAIAVGGALTRGSADDILEAAASLRSTVDSE